MQQHHGAGREAGQLRVHPLEIDAARSRVVVRIPPQRETRAPDQRLVIGPGRGAHVDHRIGRSNAQQLGADAQRAAAADGLDRGDARTQRPRQRAKRELGDPLVEFRVAQRPDVGLAGLRGDHRLLGFMDRGWYGGISRLVAVHADPEIDLLRRFVAAERGVHAQDRIGWQALDGVEHAGLRPRRAAHHAAAPRVATAAVAPQLSAAMRPRRAGRSRQKYCAPLCRTSRRARGPRNAGKA